MYPSAQIQNDIEEKVQNAIAKIQCVIKEKNFEEKHAAEMEKQFNEIKKLIVAVLDEKLDINIANLILELIVAEFHLSPEEKKCIDNSALNPAQINPDDTRVYRLAEKRLCHYAYLLSRLLLSFKDLDTNALDLLPQRPLTENNLSDTLRNRLYHSLWTEIEDYKKRKNQTTPPAPNKQVTNPIPVESSLAGTAIPPKTPEIKPQLTSGKTNQTKNEVVNISSLPPMAQQPDSSIVELANDPTAPPAKKIKPIIENKEELIALNLSEIDLLSLQKRVNSAIKKMRQYEDNFLKKSLLQPLTTEFQTTSDELFKFLKEPKSQNKYPKKGLETLAKKFDNLFQRAKTANLDDHREKIKLVFATIGLVFSGIGLPIAFIYSKAVNGSALAFWKTKSRVTVDNTVRSLDPIQHKLPRPISTAG